MTMLRQDDGWKGEHLIRAAKVPERPAPEPREWTRRRTVPCIYPGCTNFCAENSRTRLCRAHLHERPHCTCMHCSGATSKRARP